MSFKCALLKFLPYIPGANELEDSFAIKYVRLWPMRFYPYIIKIRYTIRFYRLQIELDAGSYMTIDQ